MTIQELNSTLKDILDTEPLLEFEETTDDLSHEQMYGLAQMYANKGFREYLINNINILTKSVALKSANMNDIFFGKARILTLKEILIKSKRAFESYDKGRKIDKKNAYFERKVTENR